MPAALKTRRKAGFLCPNSPNEKQSIALLKLNPGLTNNNNGNSFTRPPSRR
jgi:hypothetical protein